MSIIFFEGFETLGDETGSGDAATIEARAELRNTFELYTGVGASDYWIISGQDQGYALHMGTGNQNTLTSLIPEEFNVYSGPQSPVFIFAVLVHVPDDPTSFEVFRINMTGTGAIPNIFINNSADVRVRRGATTIEEATDVLTPGNWHFLEWKLRIDGNRQEFGTAQATASLSDGQDTMTVTDVEIQWPLWDPADTYYSGEILRYTDGNAYECIDTSTIGSTNEPPPDNPTDWNLLGPEEENRSEQCIFGQDWYFDGYPQFVYTINNFPSDPTTTFDFAPAIDEEDYDSMIPTSGTTLYFGNRGFYQVKLDGGIILDREAQTLTNGHRGTIDSFALRSTATSGDEPGEGEDFIAYDDVHVIAESGDSADPDTLGVTQIIRFDINADDTTQWTTSSGSTHYILLDENGADSGQYIESSTNNDLDLFEIEDTLGEAVIHAFKVEVEAINTVGGSPTLNIVMDDGSQATSTVTIDNTADYSVFEYFRETKPSGGAWEYTDVDSLKIGVEVNSGF